MKKWLKWEFWPYWLFYIPVYFQYIYLSLKAQSFVFFSASNPSMILGGFCTYSKSDILNKIATKHTPKGFVYKPNQDIKSFLSEYNIDFPFIVKPDIGERGNGVALITAWDELDSYLSTIKNETIIVQEYVNFPIELGVMYHRISGNKEGHISSIVIKDFPTIIGDGKQTFQQLIEQQKRTQFYKKLLFESYKDQLTDIVPKDKKIQLQNIGNHCLGTTFLNGNHLINDQLRQVFDEIATPIKGFNFGRFDLRVSSYEDLYNGQNITIMELNGANSEPAHIYDPNTPLITAYKHLFQHWKNLYKVSVANHKNGTPYAAFWSTVKTVHLHSKNR
ncbi:ATP-grasp domain-containing protein [Cyclobacteriaceae bacterium]|nr:ATP-grasp domain-containing protein [Cyclobacteriaceae bacterium]